MTLDPWGPMLPTAPPPGPAAVRLGRALGVLAEAGDLAPCVLASATGEPDHWFAPTRRARIAAVDRCRDHCPVLEECDAAATEHPPTFGVWGGVDYTPVWAAPTRHEGNGGRA